MSKTRTLAAALAMLAGSVACAQHSPYAAEAQREIKALSADEVRDYLAGKGMGLARAAELNGYPGPAHVLELAGPLVLSAGQRERTEALHRSMLAAAVKAGRELVDAESELDLLFRARRANEGELARAMARIGERQVEVRRVHLDAHIRQAEILSPAQLARYAELRGYGSPSSPATAHRGHH